jgi:hypothetical protein
MLVWCTLSTASCNLSSNLGISSGRRCLGRYLYPHQMQDGIGHRPFRNRSSCPLDLFVAQHVVVIVAHPDIRILERVLE